MCVCVWGGGGGGEGAEKGGWKNGAGTGLLKRRGGG